MAQNSSTATKQRGPGRPFQKGKSGNPGGRPKVVAEVRALAGEHAPQAFQRIVELSNNDDPRVSLAACQEILNRAYGKPPQSIDVTHRDRTVEEMRDDELTAILRHHQHKGDTDGDRTSQEVH